MERPWTWSSEAEPVVDQRRLVLAGLDPVDQRHLDGALRMAIGATGAIPVRVDSFEALLVEVRRSREAGALPAVLAGSAFGERELGRLARALGDRQPPLPVVAMLPGPLDELAESAFATGCCDVLVRGRLSADDLVRALRLAFEVSRRERAEERLKIRLLEPALPAPALSAEGRRFIALGRALLGVSHDLNNLLQPVVGYAELLMGSLDPDTRPAHYVRQVDRSARLAATLVRRLLESGREHHLPPRPVEADRRLADMEELLRAIVGRAIDLEIELDAARVEVVVREGALEQIALNLAANARDAMRDGGRLSFVTRADGETWYLEVTDTGAGVPEGEPDRLFEAGITTKPVEAGGGLGLWIVRTLVDEAGGQVSLSRAPSGGAVALVTLPVAD
jgi:signal transduction histidine kinase